MFLGVWGWFIFEAADRFGRLALEFEGLPDFFAVEIFADGPCDFAGVFVFFVRQEVRWFDEVHHYRGVADSYLPRKLAEYKTRRRFSGLKVAIGFAEIIRVIDELVRERWLDFANRDVVPVALVFAEVAKAFIGIEEKIFVPVVAFAFGKNAAALEADDFVVGATQFSARAERDHWLEFVGCCFELLEDCEIRVFRVENRVTAFANDGDGLLE